MLALIQLGDGAAAVDDKSVTCDIAGSRRCKKNRYALQLAFGADATSFTETHAYLNPGTLPVSLTLVEV